MTTKVDTDNKIKPSFKEKMNKLKKTGKKGFWLWIIYQTIKGTLTTTFIWVPMIYYYFFGK